MCNHATGKVVWAAKGRSKDTVNAFFDALGQDRSAALQFVSADGADWIHEVVALRAENAVVCLDTFHVVGWATKAVDEVRREEWNALRRSGVADAAKQVKGMRWLLLRNWENLSASQRSEIRALEAANRRIHRAWRLKEELRDVFTKGVVAARRALDRWLAYASRSRLDPFVKLARTIRYFRETIEATLKYGFTNGVAESNNASIGRLRANARGFHDPDSFIVMIMLDRAGIAPQLPWNQPA